MTKTNTSSLPSDLIERLVAGDGSARREFLAYIDGRVHLLAREILDHSFPQMRRVTDSRSVANRTLLRLLKAEQLNLETATVEAFLKYCACAVYNVLRDIARHKKRHPGDFGVGEGTENAELSLPLELLATEAPTPGRQIEAAEVLERVRTLPDDLREIVQLHGLLGLLPADVAKVLGMYPKAISRKWKEALKILRATMPGSR